jgi:protein SCO1/2
VLLSAVLAASLLAACASGSSPGGSPVTVNSPAATTAFRGAIVTPSLRMPVVALTDTSGRPWNLAERARGRVTLLYFGYTQCPDVCPTDMADLATARRSLPATEQAKVDIVFITVDQKRDTRAVIRRWLRRPPVRSASLTGRSRRPKGWNRSSTAAR